jgi:hypothetical protein
MTTAMDPTALQAAGTNAEHLSSQTSDLKAQLGQATDGAVSGMAKSQTAAALRSSGTTWDQAISKLAADMDQQGINLTTCSKQQVSTDGAIASSLSQIRSTG